MSLLQALQSPQGLLGLSVLANADRPAQGLLQGMGLNQQFQKQGLQQELVKAKLLQAQQERDAQNQLSQSRTGFDISNPMEALQDAIRNGDMDRAQAVISYMNATKEQGPSVVNQLSVGGQLDPFFESLQKEEGKDFIAQRTKAVDAANAIRSSSQAAELLNQGMRTGRGANLINYLGGALKTLGIADLEPDARANAQAFGAVMASQTAQIIKQFGAGTGLSDADREYALKAAGGDIEMDEAAIRRILEINANANMFVINGYNKRAAEVMKRGKLPYDPSIEVPGLPDFATPEPSVKPPIATGIPPGAPAELWPYMTPEEQSLWLK